jgi:hypothetical protein
MTIRIPTSTHAPYLGYDAVQVARLAAACLQCTPQAPCMLACARQADIPRVMRLAGQAACEGLSISRWFLDEDRVESARICDAITAAYS